MTWTAPLTWVTNQLVTAAQFNSNLRDDMNDLFNRVPYAAGAMLAFGGSSLPSGWLACDGAAVSRTTFAALFAVLGTTWGAGDGSTTFNVPDCRGRAPLAAGPGSGLTNHALGSNGGEEAHALSTAELPVHNHGLTDTGHVHASNTATNHTAGALNVASGTAAGGGVTYTSSGIGAGANTGSNGSGTAHANMQPWAATQWMVKT